MSPFPRQAYRPLEPYAPDRRPVPVDLSDNTNRWGAHPGALAAIRNADPEALLRYPAVYADALKAAVARRYGVPLDAVATGCGSDDILDSTFRAACEPGERVAYIPPTFSMVEIFARMNALEPWPVSEVEAMEDPARLVAAAATPGGGPGLLYLCRPNNPTGTVAPRPWVASIMALCEAPGGPVLLLDEAYADYADDDFMQEAVRSTRTVVVRTLSKSFGLAGLRVGFAVGAPEVIREIEKSRGPYKVNRLAEAAALAALDDPEGWIPGILEATRQGRAALQAGLEARGFRPLPSGANFVLVPVASAAGTTAGLRALGVAVRPFPEIPGVGDTIRVSVGPPAELDAFFHALDTLEPAVTGLTPKTLAS